MPFNFSSPAYLSPHKRQKIESAWLAGLVLSLKKFGGGGTCPQCLLSTPKRETDILRNKTCTVRLCVW